ncbi:unnamed protein product [Parascedosporium putredinis]|uniref:Uncharacterized protein n=1 Tax=Parascedosporium putredinis TaxID=1442378 RepID=A0A9P1M8C6_9PEZI|nr:unnamed protein product [Parascedosporium putredinis]CAI7989643.1 unnamed protein product [Parascedosporium putredinis]
MITKHARALGAALLAALAHVVVAEQTTLNVWVPLVPEDNAGPYYSAVVATNQQTVIALGCKTEDFNSRECPPFRFSMDNEAQSTLDLPQLVECTMTGCPSATVATCTSVYADTASGTGLVTSTSTLGSEDINYHSVTLGTPIPDETTTILCGTRTPGETETSSADEPSNTGTDGDDSDNAASRAGGSWVALAGAVVGLLI